MAIWGKFRFAGFFGPSVNADSNVLRYRLQQHALERRPILDEFPAISIALFRCALPRRATNQYAGCDDMQPVRATFHCLRICSPTRVLLIGCCLDGPAKGYVKLKRIPQSRLMLNAGRISSTPMDMLLSLYRNRRP